MRRLRLLSRVLRMQLAGIMLLRFDIHLYISYQMCVPVVCLYLCVNLAVPFRIGVVGPPVWILLWSAVCNK